MAVGHRVESDRRQAETDRLLGRTPSRFPRIETAAWPAGSCLGCSLSCAHLYRLEPGEDGRASERALPRRLLGRA
ncbi:hypothetical protein ACFYQ5_10425 [Streptomyces sp. NPDC005794]|uniref:hypothetical protein n=1 Tax=Streptomyces sp. NPDC005794 TaxID=3364733 RepID=UPI0036D1F3CF